ncbi:AraC family transcriptional regulator [Saccharibacillus alkalitolerans]|nr:AraC family transcriptional regulator [Saccharibacillus alkalitolerans]
MDRMNAALDYIEERLTEEISYAEAARAACCPAQHFQRMFAFVTDIPLAEYIRRRRLTLAAFELQNTPIKVVDVALKYGYESPEAFARAFQQLHGVTPTAARGTGSPLKAYPRLTFQFTLKGAAEMNYRLERAEAFRIAGEVLAVNTERAFEEVPVRWAKAAEEGLFGKLWEIRREDAPLRGILGVLAAGEWGRSETFDYYFAIASDAPLPGGMAELRLPAALWAVFDVPGVPEGFRETWKRMYAEWLPSSPYELADLPAVECYLPPEENRNELWIPVEPKPRKS